MAVPVMRSAPGLVPLPRESRRERLDRRRAFDEVLAAAAAARAAAGYVPLPRRRRLRAVP